MSRIHVSYLKVLSCGHCRLIYLITYYFTVVHYSRMYSRNPFLNVTKQSLSVHSIIRYVFSDDSVI